MIHNEYAQENPRINRQDRQKITFHGIAYPKEISQQCTPATHRSSPMPEGPPGGLPPLSLTTEGSWILFEGRVAKPVVSPLTPVPPSDSLIVQASDSDEKGNLLNGSVKERTEYVPQL